MKTKKKSKLAFLFPAGIWALAVGVFYGLFFCLAPWMTSSLPKDGFGPFIKTVVYVLIGYFGGIAVPIVLFIWGCVALFWVIADR